MIQTYCTLLVSVWQPWKYDHDGGDGSLRDIRPLTDISKQAVYGLATSQSLSPRLLKLAGNPNVGLHLRPLCIPQGRVYLQGALSEAGDYLRSRRWQVRRQHGRSGSWLPAFPWIAWVGLSVQESLSTETWCLAVVALRDRVLHVGPMPSSSSPEGLGMGARRASRL